MSIKKYAQFISEQTKMKKVIMGEAAGKEKNKSGGYLRLIHNEGDEVHHIHDAHYKDENDMESVVDHVTDRVAHHMHKMYPKHYKSPEHAREKYEDSLADSTDHAEPLTHDREDEFSKADQIHHKTTEDYAKREAKAAHKHIKQWYDED